MSVLSQEWCTILYLSIPAYNEGYQEGIGAPEIFFYVLVLGSPDTPEIVHFHIFFVYFVFLFKGINSLHLYNKTFHASAYTRTNSLYNCVTDSLTHWLTDSLTHRLTRSLTHSHKLPGWTKVLDEDLTRSSLVADVNLRINKSFSLGAISSDIQKTDLKLFWTKCQLISSCFHKIALESFCTWCNA